MSKLIILLTIFLPAILLSQNVAINNDSSEPHSSALLDVSSTSKGVLFPRLTTLQRTSIPGPAVGLTVFDTDTNNFWVYRGDLNGGWVELMNSFDKHWNRVGTHLFNTNPGNVGIGTNTPASKLTINDIDPIIAMMNNGIATGTFQAKGFNIKINTHPDNVLGKIILGTKDNDHFFVDHIGRVSIGTPTASSALTINGSTPRLQMQHQNVSRGYLQVDNENFILGTNAGNLLGHLNFYTKDLPRMIIEPNGNVGIGTTDPSVKLEIATDDNGQVLKLNGGNQTFMGIWENNAYRGYVGSYYGNISDVDIGSLAGAVHLVTGNTIDLTAKSGKVGIGTQDPNQLLHVNHSTGAAFIKATSGTADSDVGIDLVRDGGVRQWRIVNSGDVSGTSVGDLIFQTQSYDITSNTLKNFVFNHDYFYPFNDNSVTIGRSNKRWSVVYAGNGTINTSDARDKTNIQNINYGLADVMKLRPVSFNWKEKPQWGTKLGLIAQEVKDVIGEVVVQGDIDITKDENGNVQPTSDKYGMFYSDLIPVLIKATQEQQEMIDDLKNEILALRKLIDK